MLSNLALWHVLILLIVLAAFVLWISAFISMARAEATTGTEQAVWVLIILVAPLFGAIAWFAIGRAKSHR